MVDSEWGQNNERCALRVNKNTYETRKSTCCVWKYETEEYLWRSFVTHGVRIITIRYSEFLKFCYMGQRSDMTFLGVVTRSESLTNDHVYGYNVHLIYLNLR